MNGADGNLEHGTMKAFGIDFSEEDLVDLFATCVLCLNHAVDRASSATEILDLSIIRLRLTRWGEAVKINEKPALSHYDPIPDELIMTRQALVHFITLFDIGSSDANVIVTHLTDMDEEVQLRDSLGAIASERPLEGKSLLESQHLGLSGWSNGQSQRASSFINSLENLFGSQHLRELSASEWLRINNKRVVDYLCSDGRDLDPWMYNNIAATVNNNSSLYINTGSGVQFNNYGSVKGVKASITPFIQFT
ncbi:hypothetical protein GQ44DRAFT_731325 [Phaeosphaeriaceae sp. PMI808]|nr:hypothetical protein GQ44DRAFT_731325 [Phaeosphaeriaceae sp. PMI808]